MAKKKTNTVKIEDFKVGDYVKFTDYRHHGDYLDHAGQIAEIVEMDLSISMGSNSDVAIVWVKDVARGERSGVWQAENYWGMYKVDNEGNPLNGDTNKKYPTPLKNNLSKKGVKL